MTGKQAVLLVLRVLMEIGVVGGLAFWGFSTGNSTATKLFLGLGAPALGFGFWGAVDFHQAGRLGEPLRLLQELFVSIVAALALVETGQDALAMALAVLLILYHALVYAFGTTLLRTVTPRHARDTGHP